MKSYWVDCNKLKDVEEWKGYDYEPTDVDIEVVLMSTHKLEIHKLKHALLEISLIQDRFNCGDWDEIEEARGIANKALKEL
jgi:hypothetical protein